MPSMPLPRRRLMSKKSNPEILAHEPTELGMLCLRRRELLGRPGTIVTEITLDHQLLMSSYNTVSERALASCALDLHPGRDLSVLVGGLGLGYTAYEALASPRVGRVDVVEYLPQVIDWLDRDLVPLSEQLKGDSRLHVAEGDIFERLSSNPQTRHDLILIDIDHAPDEPLGAASESFYSVPGLQRARAHLHEGGVMAVWSYAEDSPFARALHAVFRDVSVVPILIHNDLIDEETTDWLFVARG